MSESNEKAIKVKKQIPKKEKTAKILWIIFTVILVIMIFFKFIFPSIVDSGNKAASKLAVNVIMQFVDDSIEYKNKDGVTHKYYIKLDNSYFDKNSKLKSPIIIEREEKDKSRTNLEIDTSNLLDDSDASNEKIAVLLRFANTATKKFGTDILDTSDDKKGGLLNRMSSATTSIFVIYCILFVIYSIYVYYLIWSRHYDENRARLKEAEKINTQYLKGETAEMAKKNQKPKKLTKKQKREMKKNNKQ